MERHVQISREYEHSKLESQGTTIFQSGRVYDFLDNPAEVVVLDPVARRFILLDIGRRLVAEIKIEKVVALNEWQKEWAAKQPNPVIQFFGKPQFSKRRSTRSTSELTLKVLGSSTRSTLARPERA